jgi:hypothetical protein
METAEQWGDRVGKDTTTGAGPSHPATDDGFTAPPPRVIGWSLGVVALSNVALIFIALFTGMSAIGLVACAALGLSSWLLVVAEILSVRQIERTDRGR